MRGKGRSLGLHGTGGREGWRTGGRGGGVGAVARALTRVGEGRGGRGSAPYGPARPVGDSTGCAEGH
jgi:hypothetical protein